MSVWEPTLVAAEFVRSTLVGDAGVLGALGGHDAIYPRLAPAGVTGVHLDYEFIGPEGGDRAEAMGGGIVSIGLDYALTGWGQTYNDFDLRPLMLAVMTALTGPDGRGKQFPFTPSGDSGRYQIDVWYRGPGAVPLDLSSGAAWMPLRAIYRLWIVRLA